jgi:hypothetical protein
MALCVPTLAVAAVSGIEPSEQGLAAGLRGTLGQAGGGLFLALTAAVVTASTTSAPASVPSVVALLSGFHVGLLVIAAGAALGALVALVGIRRGLSHGWTALTRSSVEITLWEKFFLTRVVHCFSVQEENSR